MTPLRLALLLSLLAVGCRRDGPPLDDDDTWSESCFTAGVEVLTPDGPVPIADLAVGDAVVTVDPAAGERRAARVLRALRAEHRRRLVLTAGGRVLDATTPEHPFFEARSQQWVPAGELRVGDVLLRDDAGALTEVRVEAVEAQRLAAAAPVFNLTVAGPWSTYLADGLLVHNKSDDDDADDWPDDDTFAPTALTFNVEIQVLGPIGDDDDSVAAGQ